jgi:hypothetical protein
VTAASSGENGVNGADVRFPYPAAADEPTDSLTQAAKLGLSGMEKALFYG